MSNIDNTKMITVESRGIVTTSRGTVFSPLSPYRENIQYIWRMITEDQADVYEIVNPTTKVRLTPQNFDKDNRPKPNDSMNKQSVQTNKPEDISTSPVNNGDKEQYQNWNNKKNKKNKGKFNKPEVEAMNKQVPLEPLSSEEKDALLDNPKETLTDNTKPAVNETKSSSLDVPVEEV